MPSSDATISTAELMVRYLASAGIRHVFGYPGESNLDFIEAARCEGFDQILATREGTAGFMAEAYGMIARRPGVCLSTLGPGSTALLAGVANAWLDRVPMIAISGQASTRREPYFSHQWIDHNRLFAPVTKWAARMEPASAGPIMRKALRIAMAERPGPVHVTTHADIVARPAVDDGFALPPLHADRRWALAFAPAADPPVEPLRLLERCRRPIILAGIAALRAGATPELIALAEKTGAAVVVAPMAKGVFPEDHPRFAGTIDMACNGLVWEFLAEGDLYLHAGFDAIELIKEWKLTAPGIHIDAVPNTDQIYQAQVELVGSIPDILSGLTGAFRGEPRWEDGAIARFRARLRDAYYAGRVRGALNPTDIIDAINERFPAEAFVSTDVGSHKMLVGQGYHPTLPGTMLMTNGLSSMGFSLPAAITARLLHPERPVVCTTGDGGFAMVSNELRLASARGLGIFVVVFCDGSLNLIELKQQARGLESELTRFERTDLVKLAESMDCDGAVAETPAQLDELAIRAAKGLDRPLVVEARIDTSQYRAQF